MKWFKQIVIVWQIVKLLLRKKVCVVVVENDYDIQTYSKGLRGKRHLKSLLKNAALDIEVQMNGFTKKSITQRIV